MSNEDLNFEWLNLHRIRAANNGKPNWRESCGGLIRWMADLQGRIVKSRGRGRMPSAPQFGADSLGNRALSAELMPGPIQKIFSEDLMKYGDYIVKLLKDESLIEEWDKACKERGTSCAIDIMRSLPSAVDLLIWLCEQAERTLVKRAFQAELVEEDANEQDSSS